MRPQIFLHIGTHKTGTTFLQYLFRKHRKELLEDDNLLFPDTGLSLKKRVSAKPDGLPGHNGFTRESGRKSVASELVSEVAAAEPRRVFISAEDLGYARPEFIRALVEDLEKIGPVSILLVLRRQENGLIAFIAKRWRARRNARFSRLFERQVPAPARLWSPFQTLATSAILRPVPRSFL
jgi:hypothetical protein